MPLLDVLAVGQTRAGCAVAKLGEVLVTDAACDLHRVGVSAEGNPSLGVVRSFDAAAFTTEMSKTASVSIISDMPPATLVTQDG